MNRFSVVFGVVFLLLVPVLSLAELDTGLKQMKREQEKEELVKMEKSASTAKDFLEIGKRYRQGIGTAPDLKQSMKWMEKAAAGGNADGAFAVGYAYYTGSGAEKSLEKGIEWLTKAGNAGHANAQYYLGNIREKGEGQKSPDKAKAASWFKMAAERGHTESMFRYAMLVLSGDGVAKNEAEGRRWLKLAADKGSILAKSELERRYPSKEAGKKPAKQADPARNAIIVPAK